ncbi:alpha/beta hydrolase [Streptomyces abikoensis]|uniref:Alpha/beta hydrolase n=1 Tax=Streptomyces abikoensis TaxID=97398 RepID=A0ABW7T5J1_9ACTN
MVTIDELKNLDTSKFTKAAEGWSAVSNRSSAARGRVDHDMLSRLGATQQGEAADAVKTGLGRLSKNYQYIHAECGMIRTALTGLAEELTVPQRKLKQALEDAQALKFTVKPDGSVEFPKSPSTPSPQLPAPAVPGAMLALLKPDSTPDPNQAKAQDIANRIGEALQEAAEIDGRYARALAKLDADPSLDKTDQSDIAGDIKAVRAAAGKLFSESKIPKGGSPKENAEWWKSLGQAERDEYAVMFPSSIGKMDGLPSSVRDEANRILLAETYSRDEERLESLMRREPREYTQKINPVTGLPIQGEQEKTFAWKKWDQEREVLKERISGMKQIQARFDETGSKDLPEAYLLGFDADGLGRAIVANGNPDTADHTAVYVPGTTTRLSKAEGDINRMASLWKVSSAMPGNPSVSTITWIGYDAPQSAYPTHNGDLIPEAASPSYADKAAPHLKGFLDGIQTAQGGPEASHTTVLGHSYGTYVVGDTSQKQGLGADDIISVASPGMRVSHADELDAPKGHVWSEAAALGNDPVPLGGKAAFLGGDKDTAPLRAALGAAVSEAVPVVPPALGYLVGGMLDQNVPSDRDFGANIMQTDSKDHSGYWDGGSVSLWNQAAVVTGNYDAVKRG